MCAEIRQASKKLGIRLLKNFQPVCQHLLTDKYLQSIREQQSAGHYCIAFGMVAAVMEIDKEDALNGFYYNAAAAMVTNTVKLVPLGQQEGQELLFSLQPLIKGDDDGWIAVVLANRVPVFDVANNKPVRYMACLVNIEGQLNVLPPLEVDPPDTFTFELAQDWSVLASLGPSPDPRVMGRIDVSDITLPGFGSMNAAPDATGAIFGAMSPAAQLRTRQATWPAALGVALDGAAAMNEAPIAAQWASATERVSAIALDPDAKRLVRDTMAGGFRLPIEAIAIEPTYRFPVLAHWSFTTSTGDTFESLMKGLDVSLLGAIAEVPKPTPTEPQVAPKAGRGPEVVETGHIGLNLRSRRGDATRAWYRGPFVPFPTTRESPIHGVLAMAHSADQVRPTVPDGREDLSLAAAFEIGRLLALSQLSVVSALLRFRNEQFGVGRIRELLNAVTAFELPAILDQRIDLGRFIAMHTIEEMAFEPARIIGPRRPIADPGRELLVRGDLDALIAGGLGLDLTAVREMSDNVGIVAALAQARVPIAHDKSGLPFDDTNIAALHGALSTELNRVLNVAVPQVRRSESVVRATAQDVNASAPDPDVLDELIEFAASRPNRFPEEN